MKLVSSGNKVGRPKGKGRPAKFRNWQPVKWKFEYEMVLLLYISGKSQKDIAETSGYSVVQVNNILSCEHARARIEEIKKNIGVKDLEESYRYILQKSAERLKTFVDNDELFEKAPLAALDRSMRAMEMMDTKLRVSEKPGSSGSTTNNTLILASQESVDRLLKASQLSEQAKQLHGLVKIG